MKRFILLYFRTLIGLPPKVNEVNGYGIIQYLKAINYQPEKRYGSPMGSRRARIPAAPKAA